MNGTLTQADLKNDLKNELAEMLDADGWVKLGLATLARRVGHHRALLGKAARARPIDPAEVAARQAAVDALNDLMAHLYKAAGIDTPPDALRKMFVNEE